MTTDIVYAKWSDSGRRMGNMERAVDVRCRSAKWRGVGVKNAGKQENG